MKNKYVLYIDKTGDGKYLLMLEYDGCYFCGGKFVVAAKTDDFNIRPKKYAESH